MTLRDGEMKWSAHFGQSQIIFPIPYFTKSEIGTDVSKKFKKKIQI